MDVDWDIFASVPLFSLTVDGNNPPLDVLQFTVVRSI